MAGYIGVQPVPQATQTRQTFTATASQTSFATAGYAPGFVDVYLNGVRLINGTDYTATNGSDIVLTSGATAGDTLEILAFGTFEVNGQAFTGDFSVDSPTFVVDSTNNRVGIGTTAPGVLLDVVSASNPSMKVRSSGGTVGNYAELTLQSYNSFSGSGQAFIRGLSSASGNSNTDLVFGTNASGFGSPVERMRIDASGNVGIGTSSPSQKAEVSNNANSSTWLKVSNSDAGIGAASGILFGNDTGDAGAISLLSGAADGSLFLRTLSTNPLKLGTNNTERMRIDSSGNVLVGKSSANFGADGIELRGAGKQVWATATSDNSLALNRLTTDGDIAKFYKDGTTVGSIGTITASGVALQVKGAVNAQPVDIVTKNSGGSDITYRFHDSLGFYGPDATQNLGRSTARWKDLYLSGGVYLGGTGAANYLDDYEVGSWSGTAAAGGGTVNIASEGYIKIGDLVHVVFTVNFSGASGSLTVYGLPFAATNWSVGIGREDASSGYAVYTRITSGNAHTDIWYAGALGNATPFQVAGGNMRISLTYSVV